MKTGRPIAELATEIERVANSKRDFILDTRNLTFTTDKDGSIIDLGNGESFNVSDHTHSQIAERLQIPKKYYDRMRAEDHQLLDANVMNWFVDKPEPRMIRTLDGRARAFVDDKYKRIDNYDLCKVVLPEIGRMNGVVRSAELTETRFHLKVAFPEIKAVVSSIVRGKHEFLKDGDQDVVTAGVYIGNSEVGEGSAQVYMFIERLACYNGYIVTEVGSRRNHVGRSLATGTESDATRELYSDETLKAEDTAYWMKIRDIVRSTVDEAKFTYIVGKMQAAQQVEIKNVQATVELAQSTFSLSDGEGEDVLKFLIDGGELSVYGLANAITRAATERESYDRSTEMERIGGNIFGMTEAEWNRLVAVK